MPEQIEIFDLEGNALGPRDREEYYESALTEYAATGTVTTKVQSIHLVLLNSKGGIYVQKRSKKKEDNPELYDKTIGGHVQAGATFDMTVIKECAEELGFPMSILSEREFSDAITNTDLNVVGICRAIDKDDHFVSLRKKLDGSAMELPFIRTLFVGYYDGAIRFSDGESSGIEVFSLEDLKQELQSTPEKFTKDLAIIVEEYEKWLRPIEAA